MVELTYTKVGDYYIPNLILDNELEQDVFYGKYSKSAAGLPSGASPHVMGSSGKGWQVDQPSERG